MTVRLLVLASGSGTLLQALLDATADGTLDARVIAVGSDRADAPALERGMHAGVPTFVCSPGEFADRAAWDAALFAAVRAHSPDWVVSAGFMRILARSFVDAYEGRIVNSHPSLLPAFPGADAVGDALAAGATTTGCTVHLVDRGVDTGPVLAQESVEILPDDDVVTLHERIKAVERPLLVTTMARLAKGAA